MINTFYYRFWFIVHNAIAHPLLVFDKEWSEEFHNWTADQMTKSEPKKYCMKCSKFQPISFFEEGSKICYQHEE